MVVFEYELNEKQNENLDELALRTGAEPKRLAKTLMRDPIVAVFFDALLDKHLAQQRAKAAGEQKKPVPLNWEAIKQNWGTGL